MSNEHAEEKTLPQIAYEAFLAEMGKTEHLLDVADAPLWDKVPADIKHAITLALHEALQSFAPALVTEASTEEQSFAQVGYQSYVASTGGLNYQGKPCPPWAELPPAIQLAWAAASLGIRTEHEHRFAGDYDLAVSKEELTELVAGLDALQRADKHQGEVCFPLRARLRAVLFPPEPAAEAVVEAPEIEVAASNEGEESATGAKSGTITEASDATLPLSGPSDADPKGEVIAGDALDPVKPATDLPATEQTEPAPSAEATPEANAPEGNVVASAPVELPAVSEAPAAPPFPAPDPAIPPPPALPTDTGHTTPDPVT